jgi:hypothetical protein
MNDKDIKGLKRLTKAGSIPMKTDKGGKTMSRDSSKNRKYKVKGES